MKAGEVVARPFADKEVSLKSRFAAWGAEREAVGLPVKDNTHASLHLQAGACPGLLWGGGAAGLCDRRPSFAAPRPPFAYARC